MTIITRRNVLQGLIAAPAIIAIERLMKPKLWVPEKPKLYGIDDPIVLTDPSGDKMIFEMLDSGMNVIERREVDLSDRNFSGIVSFGTNTITLAPGDYYWRFVPPT